MMIMTYTHQIAKLLYQLYKLNEKHYTSEDWQKIYKDLHINKRQKITYWTGNYRKHHPNEKTRLHSFMTNIITDRSRWWLERLVLPLAWSYQFKNIIKPWLNKNLFAHYATEKCNNISIIMNCALCYRPMAKDC